MEETHGLSYRGALLFQIHVKIALGLVFLAHVVRRGSDDELHTGFGQCAHEDEVVFANDYGIFLFETWRRPRFGFRDRRVRTRTYGFRRHQSHLLWCSAHAPLFANSGHSSAMYFSAASRTIQATETFFFRARAASVW